jgi:hypothetical protein
MSKISIPERVLPGFDILSNLEKSKLNNLIGYLKNIKVGIKFDVLATELEEFFNPKDSNLIVLTLISFSELFENTDRNFNQLAEELATSYVEISNSEINLDTKNKLQNNLLEIFNNCNQLITTLKAKGLAVENENTLTSVKLLSDIRPVFNLKIEEKDRSAIILHKIHLEYQKESESKDIFITLDSDDLRILLKTIERAIKKDQIIRDDYQGVFNFIN